MALTDRVFGSLPAPLIKQWGISGVYVKHNGAQAYDPALGTYNNAIDPATGRPAILKTRINIKLLPTTIEAEEVKGEVQLTDIKLLIPASYLGTYYPTVKDWVEYVQDGVQRTAKIIVPTSYRGDLPILHSLIARLG
jgi:hypothetical protein